MTFPTPEQNPEGLNARYCVTKADGSFDPAAVYFVLRLDLEGDDPEWTKECRFAARTLAFRLLENRNARHLHRLANELRTAITHLEQQTT